MLRIAWAGDPRSSVRCIPRGSRTPRRRYSAKGMSERRVVWGHAVRNGMLPVVTATALYVGIIVGGAIQVETVFSWPGMGELTYEAVLRRDYPVLEACFLLFAIFVIVANFLADLLYRVLDPRVKEA